MSQRVGDWVTVNTSFAADSESNLRKYDYVTYVISDLVLVSSSRRDASESFQVPTMAQTARLPSPESPGPQPIRRLQESVINRIAAGEVSLKSYKAP